MFLSARLLANKQQVNNTALLPSLEDRSRHQVEAWSCHRWMSPWSIDRYFIIGLWAFDGLPCGLVTRGLWAARRTTHMVHRRWTEQSGLDCKLQSLCPVPVRFPVHRRAPSQTLCVSPFQVPLWACDFGTLPMRRGQRAGDHRQWMRWTATASS